MTSPARYTRYRQIHDAVRILAATHDLTLALADLDHADPLFLQAVRRQQDARAGMPGAASYDSPSVSGGSSTSSHPERMVLGVDRTQNDRDLLDATLGHLWFLVRPGLNTDTAKVLRQITDDCYTLRRLVDAWSPHLPTDKQRASVTRANDPEAECAHHRSFGTFEPVHRSTDGGGLLKHRTPLCRFCYDRLRTDGTLPTADRLQRLADGRSDRVRA